MTAQTPLTHLKEHEDVILRDLAAIRRELAPGSGVLDVGAGRGTFVLRAVDGGYRAVALDVDLGAIGLWGPTRLPGVVGSGWDLPFSDASFDLVRMKEVIEHVEAPLALVREARRVLRPGGLLIAHTPTPYSQLYPVGNFWDDYTHVRPFSRLGLTRLIADAGMDLVKIDAYVSGRNSLERAAGRVLALVLPHIYRVTARRPND